VFVGSEIPEKFNVVYRTLGLYQQSPDDREKNRPPDERRPIHLTRGKGNCVVLEVDPNTGAYQVLPQIAILIGIDLGARVVQKVVFYEGTELRSPIVI
jgi:hypothetical protein